ncbi:MAG: hypothetical protein QM753_07370 [Thermomicrobiales bacterium]
MRLAHAAASMGAGKPQPTLDNLTVVDHGLADPSLLPALSWPHSTPEKVLRAYKLIASGLRAKSQAMLGQADAALRSLTERRGLFKPSSRRPSARRTRGRWRWWTPDARRRVARAREPAGGGGLGRQCPPKRTTPC